MSQIIVFNRSNWLCSAAYYTAMCCEIMDNRKKDWAALNRAMRQTREVQYSAVQYRRGFPCWQSFRPCYLSLLFLFLLHHTFHPVSSSPILKSSHLVTSFQKFWSQPIPTHTIPFPAISPIISISLHCIPSSIISIYRLTTNWSFPLYFTNLVHVLYSTVQHNTAW